MKVKTVTKSRNQGQNSTPVHARLYDENGQVVNRTQFSLEGKDSLFENLDTPRYTDISGMTVLLKTPSTADIVEIVGEGERYFVVKKDGVEYSVKKGICKFFKIENKEE